MYLLEVIFHRGIPRPNMGRLGMLRLSVAVWLGQEWMFPTDWRDIYNQQIAIPSLDDCRD